MALWDDRLAVASYINANGSVYIFDRADGIWAEKTILAPSDLGHPSGDGFGTSIALWREFLAVGAPSNDSAATGLNGDALNRDAMNSGAAYLFHHDGDSWILDAYIKSSNPSPGGPGSGLFDPPYGDEFGAVLGLWEGTLVASAPGEDGGAAGLDTGPASHDDDSVMDSGAVYIFH